MSRSVTGSTTNPRRGCWSSSPSAAQLEQRLAHRRDADAELGRQLVEPDVLAGGIGAVEDPVADEARHILGQLWPGSEIRCAHVRSGSRRAVAC